MLFNEIVQISVGTDLSRPLGLFNRQQGRDKSVPTENTIHWYMDEDKNTIKGGHV